MSNLVVCADEICKSLEDYNRHIEELKFEMNDATVSADLIRLDIKEVCLVYSLH
jgi:vacuolar protein sorting-associated protein 18